MTADAIHSISEILVAAAKYATATHEESGDTRFLAIRDAIYDCSERVADIAAGKE